MPAPTDYELDQRLGALTARLMAEVTQETTPYEALVVILTMLRGAEHVLKQRLGDAKFLEISEAALRDAEGTDVAPLVRGLTLVVTTSSGGSA